MIRKIIFVNKIFINLNILQKACFHKFPYNFEGLPRPINKLNYNKFMNDFFGSDIDYGFLYAYKNLIECIGQEDSNDQFIDDNCDQMLASKIKNSMEEYEGRIKFQRNPHLEEEVIYDKLWIHVGLPSNQSLLSDKIKRTEFGIGGCKLINYQNNDSEEFQSTIIDVSMHIKSQYYLRKDNFQANEEGYHYIRFHTKTIQPYQFDGNPSIFSVFKWNKKQSLQSIKSIIIGNSFSWVISDLDSIMQK